MSSKRKRRSTVVVIFGSVSVALSLAWLFTLLRQHVLLQDYMQQQQKQYTVTTTALPDTAIVREKSSHVTDKKDTIVQRVVTQRFDSNIDRRDKIGTKEDSDIKATAGSGNTNANAKLEAQVRHSSDGTFNGVDIVYKHEAPQSSVHCIGSDISGSNDKDDAWMFRSCEYKHLCMDLRTQQFALFKINDIDTNSIETAIGGINPRWDEGKGFDKGVWKVKWAPLLVQEFPANLGYYEIDTTLVPFHSFAAHNVGHLLWDDFYSIYSLLHLFSIVGEDAEVQRGVGDMVDKDNTVNFLPLRLVIQQTLYGSCDIRKNKHQQCANNFARFWPLLGGMNATAMFTTSKDLQIRLSDKAAAIKSPFVCAKRAVTGIGMLTDHGLHDHGWDNAASSWIPHNVGRGSNFVQFRNMMVQNMVQLSSSDVTGNINLKVQQHQQHQRRESDADNADASVVRVVFSLESSRDWDRRRTFDKEIAYLQHHLQTSNVGRDHHVDVQVNAQRLWELSIVDQIKLVSETDIFVTTCGGGSMSASFLPVDASLIVYYNNTGGFDFASYKLNYGPARLDWDLLNNLSHLRVHWLPLNSKEDNGDVSDNNEQEAALELLLRLIEHEAMHITTARLT